MKFEDGYWRGKYPIEVFEQRLFSNAVKKYKQYTGEEVNEDFQWYTQITFLNKKPVPLSYDSKKIKLLGDKINLKIAAWENSIQEAQEHVIIVIYK